jgi:regulator of protease activity HflC (stomatin/prohibitin superfamily)
MISIIASMMLLLAAVAVWKIAKPMEIPNTFRNWVSALAVSVSAATFVGGAFEYNDSGYCRHIRTIFGSESSYCKTGWFFEGWGRSTAWPHYITVSHTDATDADGTAIGTPYMVRLADNWTGQVTQNTRFGIPQDSEQFLKMARDFRSVDRLVTTTLRPAVTASLDSVANMFTMEGYYAGGQRGEFKTEFEEAILKGRARVRQVYVETESGVGTSGNSTSDKSQDTATYGDSDVGTIIMQKVFDKTGKEIREPHSYMNYGIIASSAIFENLDPDDRFEEQIKDRKDAASRRIIAREQRLEQEEQRLLAIQAGETNIAKRQAQAREEQIQKTTDAETEKKLALIKADRLKEEAKIFKETAEIDLERTRIEAESVQVSADAEAYAKQAILEADGALQAKLDAWLKSQQVWAEAAAQINVPATVIGGSSQDNGALSTINSFMSLMTMRAAQEIQVDPTIKR